MKKGLNTFLAFITVIYLALIAFIKINGIYAFVDYTAYATIISYILTYGPDAILALFAVINLSGKGFGRKFLAFLALVVIAAYVIVSFFPDIITNIIPIV